MDSPPRLGSNSRADRYLFVPREQLGWGRLRQVRLDSRATSGADSTRPSSQKMVESCVALKFPTADAEQMAMPLKDIWNRGGRGAAAHQKAETTSAIIDVLSCRNRRRKQEMSRRQ